MSVRPAGHWPGVRVAPLAPGTSLPCVGGRGWAQGPPPCCQRMPGCARSASPWQCPCSFSLPICWRTGGSLGDVVWGGTMPYPMPPAAWCLSLSPRVGFCRCSGPMSRSLLLLGFPIPAPLGGHLALQAGRRQVPSSGGEQQPP